MKVNAVTRITSWLLLTLSWLPVALAHHPAHAGDGEYSIGVVPQFDARRILEVWQPIIEELERRSGIKLRLEGSASIPVFEKQFQDGNFDFAYMNPYHLLVANDSQGYLPLVRDHGRALHGILVVHKDSPYSSPSELGGQTIAFPAPNALGAALMMRADLDRRFGIDFTPSYVKSHSSVYLNVLLGQAVAGGGVRKTLNAQPPEVRDALRIIYTTDAVAPHPLTAHPRVPEEVRERIKAAFLELAQTPEGQALLARIPMSQAGEANMEDYQPLREMGLENYFVAE